MSPLTQHAGMYLGSQRPEDRQKRYVPAIVHILDGQTDQIVQTLDNSMDSYNTTDDEQAAVSLFWDDEHKYMLKDEGHFDFKTTYNNSDPIKGRNRVVILSEGGDFFHEFIIDETVKNGDIKEVYSTPSELDLRKAKVIDPFEFNNYTLNIAANTALGNTEWALGIVETDGVRSISISSYTNPYSVLTRIATTWELEIRFRVEVRGHQIVGRYVDFLEKRGVWRGKEITLGKDLKGVKRTENAEDVVTALLVVGPEPDEGEERITVEVTDDEARQRWSRTGAHLWDVHEPETDREELSKDRLETIGRTELNKRVNPDVEYETEAVSLEYVFGLDHEVTRIGDTVRVKDTSYEPALYMEARIFDITRSLTDPSQKTYKLGDVVERDPEDIEALEQRLRGRIARKIGLDTLETYAEKKKVKSETEPEDTEVIWVDTSVEPNVVRTYNGTNWVRATPTRASEVGAYDRSEVDQRIQDAEEAMNTAAENYAQQYSESYYEDNITSAVQEAKTYSDEEIAAAKNELGADISTLEDAVEIRAFQTEVDEIEGRMTQAESTINVHTDEIDLKVNVDDVIASVNLSDEGVRIRGNVIEITGETFIDDAVIKNANIDSLDGGKLQAETVTAIAMAVNYLSAITADLGVVNAGELNAVDIFASRIEGSEFISSNGSENLEILSGRIRSSNELIIEAPDGLRFYGANIIKMANGTSVDNTGGFPRLRRNEQDYIIAADREMDFYLYGDRKFRFYTETDQPDTHTLIANGRTKMKGLNRSTRAVQFRNNDDSSYIEVQAAEFTIGSSEKTKENFESFDLDVMKQILQTPIYTYTRKPVDEDESTPVKVGTKFEEMPVRLRREGETIDIYGMVAYSWKGLQETDARIVHIEERMKAKDEKINRLEERLRVLEEEMEEWKNAG